MVKNIWIFNGANGRFASGVFEDIDEAEKWIGKYKLTGVLTNYPVNISVYDWATENGFFSPKREEHTSPEFSTGKGIFIFPQQYLDTRKLTTLTGPDYSPRGYKYLTVPYAGYDSLVITKRRIGWIKRSKDGKFVGYYGFKR
ncbi:hypothetical protein SAMN05518672_11510 [Chitinophaga sp. CF118]|uniref:DUF7710 domain-containing protein n=1 Tax=Chitinophaga sp. CF118 TaxID=1884367 RepID=UPI0008EF4562|nr:hypothetical protein [Chitinophaga sp. CF118]SFF05899.1 hypothetical protein SAMN05518672_11510 [Chitinophaga sp. CF118]